MEEQNKVIRQFLSERGLAEEGLTSRLRKNLEHIFMIVSEMNSIISDNVISVKNVAKRTQEERYGHSISLATFYNNGKVLYDFVEYLKLPSDPTILDQLEACRNEIAELREINAALIRRDVKFEEMQSEIDSLRSELRLARRFNESNATSISDKAHSATPIPPPRKVPKS